MYVQFALTSLAHSLVLKHLKLLNSIERVYMYADLLAAFPSLSGPKIF